jgi:hypothetical protein
VLARDKIFFFGRVGRASLLLTICPSGHRQEAYMMTRKDVKDSSNEESGGTYGQKS